jgi:hypothetical protein
MKKNIISFSILFLCIGTLFVLIILTIELITKRNIIVKPGEVYEWSNNEENPFVKPVYYRDSVIDVKNGYVLYINERGDTNSSKVSNFSFKKLIK